MHHWRVGAGDSYLRKARRERARGNFRGSADRRARASDYLPAWIIRAHDEAKPLRDVRQMPGAIFGDAHDEERTARCGTITRRPRLRRRGRSTRMSVIPRQNAAAPFVATISLARAAGPPAATTRNMRIAASTACSPPTAPMGVALSASPPTAT